MELKEKTVFILSVNPEEEKVSSVGLYFFINCFQRDNESLRNPADWQCAVRGWLFLVLSDSSSPVCFSGSGCGLSGHRTHPGEQGA